MSLWFGITFANIATPAPQPSHGVTLWSGQTFNLLYDNEYFADNVVNVTLQETLAANSEPLWITLSDPDTGVSFGLASGGNHIDMLYPMSVILTLFVDPGFTNTWYGSADIQKLGFIRRLGDGFKDEIQWINLVGQEFFWTYPFGDQLEIVLAPGVSGSAQVFTWLGIPPTLQAYGGTGGEYQPFDLGWYWEGTVSL